MLSRGITDTNCDVNEENSKKMVESVVELAGIPILIRCRFKTNQRFFKDYLSDREPLLIIEASDYDMERIQKNCDAIAQAQGLDSRAYHGAYLENNALHERIAGELTAYQVLLMHGSALCMDGQAYIFMASSGTGKSTHARLWREVFGNRVWMINDDKPLLRISEDKVLVYGSPWDGKHRLSSNNSAPLKAVAHLVRGRENLIRPLPKPSAYQVFRKHTLWPDQPQERTRVLELQKKLIEVVDFYELYCNMSSEAAQVAWQGMNHGGRS